MAESKIPKKKIKLGSSINDSGIEEVDYDTTELHASEAPDEVIDDSNEDSDNEDPSVQTQYQEAGESNPSQSIIGRAKIRFSDDFEKDTSINFTINFLTLWDFKDYITLFKEHNINKERFLSLGEKSEVLSDINDSNDVKRILKKKMTLLDYLKRPDYIRADEVGYTLAKFLKRDPKRKIWLESPLTREVKKNLSKFIVDNILHTQLRRAT
ncbi:uncharacterized protein [Chelonus insularis]|nr:uncharacterized protein LOC118071056 isoform X2 [Chelonus insularis]